MESGQGDGGIVAAAAAAAAGMASSNSRRLLKALSDMLLVPETKAEMVRQVGSRLRLLVGDDKCLVLDLRQAGAASGAPAVLHADTKTEVDAILHLSDADFAVVCAGELAPGLAFMTGRLTVRGNLVEAMKCGPVFELLRPHTRPLPPPRPLPHATASSPLARL